MLSTSTDSEHNTEWTSEIIDAIEVEGFIQYIIEITQNDHKWLIRRNYKEFQAFHKKLTQNARSATLLLPKLPPKSYSMFGPNQEFLDKRRELLQDYLHNLSESPALSGLPEVESFLQPERYKGLSSSWQGDVELPVYYPVLTSESLRERLMENEAYGNIKYKNKKSVNYFIKYGQSFLKTLFIFERSLNISSKFVAKAIIFDRQRANVRKAARFFTASADVFRKAVAVATDSGDAEAAAFLTKCLDVSEAADRWCATFSEEEAAVVRMAVKAPQAEIREIEWYRKEVAKVVAAFDPYATTHPLEDAKKLYMALSAEIRYRSQAEQVVAVKTLRPLMHEMSSVVRFASTKKSSKASAPPPDVIRVHFKRRLGELERAVSLIIEREDSNSLLKEEEEKEKEKESESEKEKGERTGEKESEEGGKGSDEDDHSLFDMEDFVLCDGDENEDVGAYANVVLSRSEVISRIKQLTSDIKLYRSSDVGSGAAGAAGTSGVISPREGEEGPAEPIEKILKDIDAISESALKLKERLEEETQPQSTRPKRGNKYDKLS